MSQEDCKSRIRGTRFRPARNWNWIIAANSEVCEVLIIAGFIVHELSVVTCVSELFYYSCILSVSIFDGPWSSGIAVCLFATHAFKWPCSCKIC